jgi:hypothetical protein
MKKWLILRYTQKNGFEEIECPFEVDEAEDVEVTFKRAGFEEEERDGAFDCYYDQGLSHRYHKDGRRITEVMGVNRYDFILTGNAAEHMALRVVLAPLAHMKFAEQLAAIRQTYGTLAKYEDHRRRRLEEERATRTARK